jgi:uncharacterized membrane protein YjjP (DUF1212 family)
MADFSISYFKMYLLGTLIVTSGCFLSTILLSFFQKGIENKIRNVNFNKYIRTVFSIKTIYVLKQTYYIYIYIYI